MTEVADTFASRRQSWRNAWVLIAAQAILGSQMSMIFIVGGLAGAMLAPNRCLAPRLAPPAIGERSRAASR